MKKCKMICSRESCVNYKDGYCTFDKPEFGVSTDGTVYCTSYHYKIPKKFIE